MRIAGDNIAVLRFCAQEGRLRRPDVQAMLEVKLGALYASGWCIEWLPIRRRVNNEADALATAGVMRAAWLAEHGNMDAECVWTED
ncbi:MAG: hypothetical protein ACKPKO_55135 [Candidatus Fonsibacter sp.]